MNLQTKCYTTGILEDPARVQGNSKFETAVFRESKEEANTVLAQVEQKQIILFPQSMWLKRALENDCAFSKEEFDKLPKTFQKQLFLLANAFFSFDLVTKLNAFGMYKEPVFWPGPTTFALNMDIVTARNVMKEFLRDLKDNNLLITEEEFSKLNKSLYVRKLDQIGRIQGSNFIQKVAEENDLNHIKVPSKFVVLNKELKRLSLRLHYTLEIKPKEDQLSVYAQRINRVDRKISLEEAIEFSLILIKTGYNDFGGDNFFIAEDGIYFIDTEYKDFDPNDPQFDYIKQEILSLLHSNDKQQFLKEFQKQRQAYEKLKSQRYAEAVAYDKACGSSFQRLVDEYEEQFFTFPVNSLLPTCLA